MHDRRGGAADALHFKNPVSVTRVPGSEDEARADLLSEPIQVQRTVRVRLDIVECPWLSECLGRGLCEDVFRDPALLVRDPVLRIHRSQYYR
jgi:hypothetical protein